MKRLGPFIFGAVYVLVLITQLPHVWSAYANLEDASVPLAQYTAFGAAIAFELSIGVFTFRIIKGSRRRWTRRGLWFFIVASVVANGYYYRLLPLVFDLVMPVVYPRCQAILVETKMAKIIEKYGLHIEDTRKSRKELLQKMTSQSAPRPIVESCDRKLDVMQMVLDEFRREVGEVEPTLVEPVDKLKRKIGYEMDKLREKLVQAQQSDFDVDEQQVSKLRAHLFPEGKEQERVFNIYPYLFAYGIQLIPMLEKKLDIFSFERQTIYV